MRRGSGRAGGGGNEMANYINMYIPASTIRKKKLLKEYHATRLDHRPCVVLVLRYCVDIKYVLMLPIMWYQRRSPSDPNGRGSFLKAALYAATRALVCDDASWVFLETACEWNCSTACGTRIPFAFTGPCL